MSITLTTTQLRGLESQLRSRVNGEVRFDAGSRAAYSTDASNYRHPPLGVVVPVSVDDGAEAVAVCREHRVRLHSRGGGTSLAGQCCNDGIAIDWSKYCDRLIEVDAQRQTAVVEPGIALDKLNDQLAPYGLMVGPKPSTHETCTIGGMVGNNSCGATAQAYGKTADAVQRLEILTYAGVRTWVGQTSEDDYREILRAGGAKAELYQRMRELRDRYLADIRQGFPAIPRRVSGYNLDALLPERGFDVAKALVGSEGTLVTVLRAEIGLVEVEPERTIVVLGYSDINEAADDVVRIAAHEPTALEGFDKRLVELEQQEHLAESGTKQLPHGNGWLIVQLSGHDKSTVDQRARRLIDDLGRHESDDTLAFVTDPAHEDALWKSREAGLGATAFPPGAVETHAGWEDAAVAPEQLGAYLRDFRRLLQEFGYDSASLYGHFGQGCVHTRLPSDLRTAHGIAEFRQFTEAAARLIASYGGSLSGEHGDGQARGELLPIMFGNRLVAAFSQFKFMFDPDDLMNPGKLVRPRRLDQDLRQGSAYRPLEPATHFAYPNDKHRFSDAVNRCVGVGKCRGHGDGVMCPSFRATKEEEHSTRGRARLLYEMLEQDVVQDGWRSTEVRDALDLCLACKGCKSDCPTNVDMATYKAEFLSHHYAGRPRPASHYSMGWLPLWARLAASAPQVINSLTHTPLLSRLLKRVAGIAAPRDIPLFAPRRFHDTFHPAVSPGQAERGTVLLWPDTFNNNLQPQVAQAAVKVLEAAGFAVVLPERVGCCGLTWISTGQLTTAKRVLRRTLDLLRPQLRDGTPIVVLEPSCAAVFRSDLPELLHGDRDAHRLAAQTTTVAELLSQRASDWRPPTTTARALARVHCHQHAIMGFDADTQLLRQCGVDLEVSNTGCCGLAGNFGFEREHYEVSMACAQDSISPLLDSADADTVILADGFSCRTQIAHTAPDRAPHHLVELLAAALDGHVNTLPDTSAEPSSPGRLARAAAIAAPLAALAATATIALRKRRRYP